MSELAFAKQFLTALDSRPIRISTDNVVDPKTYPAQSAHILPRLPNAKRKRGEGAATADTSTTQFSDSVTVSLKPMKPGAPSITLSSQASTKSVYDIKATYASQAKFDVTKIKLLRNKKPVADSKSLSEVLGDGGDASTKELEFSVMVMAGAAASPAPASTTPGEKMDVDQAAPVAQGSSGAEVLGKEEFWDDLKGFLLQRTRDEDTSQTLLTTFRRAWQSSTPKE